MPTCFKCNLTLPSVAVFHSHLKYCAGLRNQTLENGFRCAESEDCFKTFSIWSKFKLHLVKDHNCPLLGIAPVVTVNNAESISSLKNVAQTHVANNDVGLSETEHSRINIEPLFNVSEAFEDTLMEFVSKLYANHKLPRSHVVEIMKGTSTVLNSMLDLLKPEIRKVLEGKCENETILNVEKQLDSQVAPFEKFSSEYFFIDALEKKDLFISKHTSVIGSYVDHVMYKGKIIKKVADVTVKLIPMRVVLAKIFSIPKVLSAVNAYVAKLNSETNMLENFIQGKLWKQKVLNHFQGKIVFPLFMYFDDFEVGNPLGSHAGINKLGGIYYSVPCFPPEVQSLLDNIFVAGLFYSSDRAMFSNYRIFKPVIDELNFLQTEGITAFTENGPVHIHFALGLVLGDNLGLNQILGFQESFSAYHSCRFCQIDKFQMQFTCNADMRTSDLYDLDVAAANPRETGIKEKSVWDNVKFFKTCENYAVDFLHDGPEGAFKKFMGLIVHYFSFTLKSTADAEFLTILNDRLNCFDYYHNCIRNKPPLISNDEASGKRIKMSASELQNFILIFAMLVGDIVPHDDEVWQFYLCMRKLNDIVVARRVPKDWVALLKSYTSEIYERYLKTFPTESVTIKLHLFAAHYHTVLDESGPFPHMSTFRFESKHKNKKAEANATSSRVNIIETLVHKELLVLAHRFLLGRGFAPNHSYGKVLRGKITNEPGFSTFKNKCPPSFLTNGKKMNWVKISGQTYRKGSCIVLSIDSEMYADEMVPVFAKITSVFQDDSGEVLILCRSLFTVGFETNLHAYEVQETNLFECILLSKLVTPFPVLTAHLNGTLYVTLRHAL